MAYTKSAMNNLSVKAEDAPAVLSKLVEQFISMDIDFSDIPVEPEKLDGKKRADLEEAVNLAQNGNLQTAYELALKKSGTSFEFDYLRGKILFSLKSYYEAHEAFAESLTQFSEYAEVWFYLGMCDYQMGLLSQGFMEWHLTYDANKNHEDARLLLNFANTMMKTTHRELNPEAEVILPIVNGRGVDVGCGGVKTHKDAIGVDLIAPGELGDKASQKGIASQADIYASGDDLNMFTDGELDYVIARHNLEHYTDPLKTLLEWRRVLKTGGVIGLVLPDDDAFDTIHADKTHAHVFTQSSFRNIISIIPDLEIAEMGISQANWSFYAIVEKVKLGEKASYPYRRKLNEWLAKDVRKRAELAIAVGLNDVASAALRCLSRLLPDEHLLADPDQLHPFPFSGFEPKTPAMLSGKRKVMVLKGNYLADAYCAALEKMGYAVARFPFSRKQKLSQHLERRIRRFNPDFIISATLHPYLSESLRNMDIPYVVWSEDIPTHDLLLRRDLIPDNTRLFHGSVTETARYKKLGVRNAVYLPPAIDYECFKPTSAKDVASYDISLVVPAPVLNMYETLSRTLRKAIMSRDTSVEGKNRLFEWIGKLGKIITGQLEACVEWKTHDLWNDIIGDARPPSIANMSKAETLYAIGDEASCRKMAQLLSALSGFDLHVWGELNCKVQAGVAHDLSDYLSQAPLIYSGSKINIYTGAIYEQDVIPSHMLEIMSAGGFVLAEHRDSYEDAFETGKDLVCFKSYDEAKELAEYYLSHPDERKAIAESGRLKVAENYLLKDRLETIIDAVAE
ncbi:hypothetical protein MNBD_NITROSPINAE01-719 [hydrothermal vent metagenome]|uniref:Uncharacterized protein n=1 Tax=hydrothermal vent metagenome TaxID=652676 RepID=A0A3B1BXU8_9ZZZZ